MASDCSSNLRYISHMNKPKYSHFHDYEVVKNKGGNNFQARVCKITDEQFTEP